MLRYVKTTKHYSLIYSKSHESKATLIGFTDSDYAGSIDDRKSTSGYAFKFGECLVSWHSAKQHNVSLSSTEAEYIALTNAVKECSWLRLLLSELKQSQEKTTIYCDNKSTICLSMNPEFHSRTKHIDIRYHYIREVINN